MEEKLLTSNQLLVASGTNNKRRSLISIIASLVSIGIIGFYMTPFNKKNVSHFSC